LIREINDTVFWFRSTHGTTDELEHEETDDPIHDSMHPELEANKVWDDFLENGFEVVCEDPE
jgi:hypothetical protein